MHRLLKGFNPEPVKPVVIVLENGRLNEAEIQKAFAGNAGALWYKALVCKIDSLREDQIMAASVSASQGNQLAMAGAVNAYEALSALLVELDRYANSTKD